ncbi:hypothetical protein HanXRQr2_Chr08g0326361 [Helianthus annuus]|uniref:Uncharacterized protein n=1 Tax=Helianthus annuus TaxID=4232 RepID=A0A251U4G3_HELAN|nr:hypothetical protein HanXRQr2_Chr08g0326361 [Helianthus annuus]
MLSLISISVHRLPATTPLILPLPPSITPIYHASFVYIQPLHLPLYIYHQTFTSQQQNRIIHLAVAFYCCYLSLLLVVAAGAIPEIESANFAKGYTVWRRTGEGGRSSTGWAAWCWLRRRGWGPPGGSSRTAKKGRWRRGRSSGRGGGTVLAPAPDRDAPGPTPIPYGLRFGFGSGFGF